MAKKQLQTLEPELAEMITKFIIAQLREEEATQWKTRIDKRRANTKMLLRNYRSIVDHCENAIYEATQIDAKDIELAEILELMSNDRSKAFRIESIRESAARTRLIVDHINEMLEMYKIFCERSQKPEDMRRYRVVHAMYIAKKPKSAVAIGRAESIDDRTVYRDIDSAVEYLTVLLFGVDGLHLLKK